MNVEPLGIGLIGLGRWGRNYVKTLLGLSECRLIAVADPNPSALAPFAHLPGVAARNSAALLLSDSAIKAIIIATPDHTHCPLAAATLQSGRDVLVEKPMALNLAEAESLVRQAEAAGHVLAVGHTAVYSTDIDSLRAQLDTLPHGSARRVRAERTSSGPPGNSECRTSKFEPRPSSIVPRSSFIVHRSSDFGLRPSSVLFDLCPHDIALAILLLGAPAAARAVPDGNGVAYEIRFAGGGLLEGKAEWREPPHIRRFEVADAQGTPSSASRPSSIVPRSSFIVHRSSDFGLTHDSRDTPLERQCLDFIECCRTRRQPQSNGRLGLAVVRCLAAMNASVADDSNWVALSTEDERRRR
jgi:predicted dehydrogenase